MLTHYISTHHQALVAPERPVESVAREVLCVASRTTRIPTSVLDAPVAHSTVDARSAGEVIQILHTSDRVQALIRAAYRELFNRVPIHEQPALFRLTAERLSKVEECAMERIAKYIEEFPDPKTVIRALHERRDIAALSRHLTALLGLDEEKVGGELERHSREQQKIFDARGGYMYQASDVHAIRNVFSTLAFRPGASFYDLGSGYGHVVFYGGIVRPDLVFKGIELMSYRTSECQRVQARLGITNMTFEAGDIVSADISQADVLFLFNPFPPDVRLEVSRKINDRATQGPLLVIDYGGMVTQDASELIPAATHLLDDYRVAISKRFHIESLAIGALEKTTIPRLKKGGSR